MFSLKIVGERVFFVSIKFLFVIMKQFIYGEKINIYNEYLYTYFVVEEMNIIY